MSKAQMGQKEEESMSEFPEKLSTKENGEIPENHLKSKIRLHRDQTRQSLSKIVDVMSLKCDPNVLTFNQQSHFGIKEEPNMLTKTSYN